MKDEGFNANGANVRIPFGYDVARMKNKDIRGICSLVSFALKTPALFLVLLLASCKLEGGTATPTPSVTSVPSPTFTFTAAWQVGDLGWGEVTGHVNDALTGAPIPGAVVTCGHFSYTSPALCQSTTYTDANGDFIFEDVFFHDTDRIALRVTAAGYEPQTFEQDSFAWPELYINLYLMPSGYTPRPVCTPPLCAIGTNETYYCAGDCPGGCGTTCATYTPTP